MDPFQELDAEITACVKCPRLVSWRQQTAREKRKAYQGEEYWGRPVPGFGDLRARVLVVGLAPGAHGSNRTGRMFTGDASGDFLYPALHRAGFASQPGSRHREDGLSLIGMYITAAGRCAPPDNKPTPEELRNCAPFLMREIDLLEQLEGCVALGSIAYQALLPIYRQKGWLSAEKPFGHLVLNRQEPHPWLLASYHPSRQNTQTGRLTVEMFDQVWSTVRSLLKNA